MPKVLHFKNSARKYVFLGIFLLAPGFLYSAPHISKHKVKKAMRSGELTKVTALVDFVPDINKAFFGDKNLLHWAIWYHRFDVVKLLVSKGADVNQTDRNNESPLCMSTFMHTDSIAEFLIQHDADPNIFPVVGFPAIINVARKGQYGPADEHLFKLLLDKGAEIDVTGCTTTSLYLTCCGWGTPTMIQWLLDRGIKINETDEYHRNGLVYAIAKLPGSIFMEDKKYATRRLAVIRFLIENGIDTKQEDIYGHTVEDYADKTGDPKIIALMEESHK